MHLLYSDDGELLPSLDSTLLSISHFRFGTFFCLIADGKHCLSDLLSDFVVLLANRASQKDADEEHPYGHQRFETAASLALGAILLAVGVGMLWLAAVKLENPSAIAQVHVVALYVALGTLVAKEMLFCYMLGVAKRVKSSMLVAAIR